MFLYYYIIFFERRKRFISLWKQIIKIKGTLGTRHQVGEEQTHNRQQTTPTIVSR